MKHKIGQPNLYADIGKCGTHSKMSACQLIQQMNGIIKFVTVKC